MPEGVARLASTWGFVPEVELPRGFCCRVWANQEAVLRVPELGEELESGYCAAWELGESVGPKVLKGDPSTGALLMERILPGHTLGSTLPTDDESWRVICGAIRRLPMEAEGMLLLGDFFESKSSLLGELLASGPEPRFLHGDLHPENLLWSEAHAKWVVIDPKGLLGDPHFEPVAFLRNPLGQLGSGPQLVARLRTRLAMIEADLGLDPWRVAAWGYLDQIADGESPLAEAYRTLMAEWRPGTF